MGKNSEISWTHHTFNPWWGCMKVSPACDHCYAETWANRFGDHWGPKAEYRTFGDKHWNEPLRWDRAAEKAGERHRVFCASMADVFDNRAPEGVRERLWALIRETPHLDWLLLTKRPQNIAKMLPEDWGDGYPNVWLGVTVENQVEADRRIPILLQTEAAVRFLSCEPLLGPVDLKRWIPTGRRVTRLSGESVIEPDFFMTRCEHCGWVGSTELCHLVSYGDDADVACASCERIFLCDEIDRLDWVICGGESGPGARPMHPAWASSLRDQCVNGVVAFHFKQWGDWAPVMQGREWMILSRDGVLDIPDDRAPDEQAGEVVVTRLGKKAAGRLLDGRTWDELPTAHEDHCHPERAYA